jgi:mannose-6-phosphate isomerase class I
MYKYPTGQNYDLNPSVPITDNNGDVIVGNNKLAELIKRQIKDGNKIFVFDLYPGVDKENLISLLKGINHRLLIETDTCKLPDDDLHKMYDKNITEDRVFGYMVSSRLENCFNKVKVAEAKSKIEETKNEVIFVVGLGASLFAKAEVHYYFDITRWEIQLRFRDGMANWMFENSEAPILTKYKIGFFVEWRLADTHKEANFDAIDYWVDANVSEELKVIDKKSFHTAFHKISKEPFRMEPYFDKSVWGGQWMKNIFGLDKDAENFGWAFDGVPEENSVRFTFGENSVVFPTMNLVKRFPKELLGEKVYNMFGAEFPIRFDLLDTFEGGNLSLQVHPTQEYIKSTFGMDYTQDESYYILDATESSCVYIGLKEGIDKEAMISELEAANRGEIIFNTEKYVNKIPVKKHDHILIPAGTVHCSGKDTLVLEISATPYIFTFKLWDWGNIGLDGLPRPVHINHGKKNIQWNRDTHWVMNNLIHQEKVLQNDDKCMIERTGLHEYEFIETKRYSFHEKVEISLNDSVAVLNLIEGKEAWIKSSDNSWPPKKIHYGETFIVPASAWHFIIESCEGNDIRVIVATIR